MNAPLAAETAMLALSTVRRAVLYRPSSAEIARLEEVIGDPGAHCVSGAIRWPHETRRPSAPAETGRAA